MEQHSEQKSEQQMVHWSPKCMCGICAVLYSRSCTRSLHCNHKSTEYYHPRTCSRYRRRQSHNRASRRRKDAESEQVLVKLMAQQWEQRTVLQSEQASGRWWATWWELS